MQKVFDEYEKIYRNILNIMYPSEKSTGFTERNLTVNFSKAYERVYKDDNVAIWFEFQFNVTNHLDCIIINKTKKQIYLIESKRYVNSKKEDSISNDIKRLQEIVDNDYIKGGDNDRVEHLEEYAIYGVILADIWLENNYKESKYNEYIVKSNYYEKSFDEEKTIKGHFYVNEFINNMTRSQETYKKYKLLSFVWKLKDKQKDLFETWLNKENESKWVHRALTDNSYKKEYTRINHKEYQEKVNFDLATYGDTIIKHAYCELLLDAAQKLSEEKAEYESDEYLVKYVHKHYDLIEKIHKDTTDLNIPKSYDYDNYWNESLNNKYNKCKYIATCVEAMIGAIYKETNDMDSIIELMKSWMDFKKIVNK